AAAALLVAGIAAGEPALVAAAGVVAIAGPAARPRRRMQPARSHRRSRVLVALALLACVPGAWYAFAMAANQRHAVAPLDAHLALHAWAALAAAAFAAVLTALLAAARTDGS